MDRNIFKRVITYILLLTYQVRVNDENTICNVLKPYYKYQTGRMQLGMEVYYGSSFQERVGKSGVFCIPTVHSASTSPTTTFTSVSTESV
jgi:hypothetical protein